MKEFCSPFFVFDNIESYQETGGGEWIKNTDVLEGIQLILEKTKSPVLLTGRYPLREFPDLAIRDLNAVSFGDFYKKCWQLPLHRLADRLEKGETPTTKISPLAGAQEAGQAPTFEQICQILHRAFGGNYRALEFFDELYARRGDEVFGTLERLDDLPADAADDVRRRMSENLVFGELLALLTPGEKEALALLSKFRIPVLPMAPGMQRDNRDFSAELERIADLTLAERDTDRAGKKWFYVMPLVQDLLVESGLPGFAFSEKTAGDYHDYVVKNDLGSDNLTEHAEAFEWYYAANAEEDVNRIGERLCRFYYQAQQFRPALVYGLRTEEVCSKNTDGRIWNNIGLILQTFGRLDAALDYFKKSLADDHKKGDRQGEGTTLNNISQIHKVRGDYDTALAYLQQSLKIQQEIGDRQGEGTTLNNISQIHKVRGDYDTALAYLQQSLKIQQEIGDRQGEGTTLNNISQIHKVRGDYDTALAYLQQSLKIRQEIGDRQGEGTTLNNISQIYDAKGDYDTALAYLQQSLKIRQEIGDRQGEGTTLNNISQIYDAKGDYDTALAYLQQSLKIRQEIGDRQGEGTTLNNISQIYDAKGDYDTALAYLQQSLKIRQEIGDRKGEGTTLNNISQTTMQKATTTRLWLICSKV
ncbi:MAG: tetratricopeptide repeat protein [Lewinellaceae bacterium]|nr:tetratricopeptide repeat protein [Lewinellaceae bacterium]